MLPSKYLASRYSYNCSNFWVEYSDLVKKYSEVNLGQGFPNYAPTGFIQKTLADVVMEGNDFLQYTNEKGHLRLRKAVASLHSPLLGRDINAETEVVITHGAVESLQCAILGLVNPGDEVILIEPFFDCYYSMVLSAGATPVLIPLRPSKSPAISSKDWFLDPDELASKFSEKTKMIILNTPHNPIGKVFTKQELEFIAGLCVKHDIICVSDEVYEWLVFPGNEHIRIANLPNMWERTITISSASKSFSVTGWRIGWSVGPEHLMHCLLTSHQTGDIVCNTPAQEAIARCIEREIDVLGTPKSHLYTQLHELERKRDLFVQLLQQAGFTVCVPDAGTFIIAEWSNFISDASNIEDGTEDSPDFKFSKWLIRTLKIAAVPPTAFVRENKDVYFKYIRFCFFKTDEVLNRAGRLVQQYHDL